MIFEKQYFISASKRYKQFKSEAGVECLHRIAKIIGKENLNSMNCPNCGLEVSGNAHFCQNCGYRFDGVSSSEPIRIVISPPPQKDAHPILPSSTAIVQPVIVEQPSKSTSNGVVIALTVLVTLLLIGSAALLAGYLLFARGNRQTASADNNANVTPVNTNVNLTAKPSPTTYEDLKNKIAPPGKSTPLVDEQFSVAASAHRAIPFSVTDSAGARLAGGFRVTKGNPINFYVYPADAYNQYPTNGLKPIQFEQTRNKILNANLKTGDYYLVFENNDTQPATVATELLLVNNETK